MMSRESLSNRDPVADYFDHCAEEGIFEEFSPEELPVVRELFQQMEILPGQKIVEPGCGEGRLTKFLSDLVEAEGKVFAFDISVRMVEKCRARGFPKHVEVAQARVSELPLPDGEFDAIVCLNTFPHFEDRPAALRELRRVLRKEGLLWVAHTRSREWVNSLHASIGGVLSTHLIPTEGEFNALFQESGFRMEFLRDLRDRYLVKASRTG